MHIQPNDDFTIQIGFVLSGQVFFLRILSLFLGKAYHRLGLSVNVKKTERVFDERGMRSDTKEGEDL